MFAELVRTERCSGLWEDSMGVKYERYTGFCAPTVGRDLDCSLPFVGTTLISK